jgi:hypothetical protein
MQGSERDPEVIVRRLLQSETHLSARARDEVLALGTGAVPALLRILDNEVLEGWAPVHAVRLLGEMRISAAIGPMLRALAETDPLDMLRDAILASLPKIGEPVIEPALRAYAEADDRAFRVSVGSILARIGVLDDRIFAVLLEMLEISPSRAADLAQYGDDRALPYLSRAFDAYVLGDSDSPFANQDLLEVHAAIEELGGTLTSRQLAKYRRACEPGERWRRQLDAALESRTPGERAARPRPGRNEPCWCGSSRKYKRCHLDTDENTARSCEARV